MELLALAGSDIGIKDNIGRTGREITEENGHAEVLARLQAVVSDQLRATHRGKGYARSARSTRSTHRYLQVLVTDMVHKIIGALHVTSSCVARVRALQVTSSCVTKK